MVRTKNNSLKKLNDRLNFTLIYNLGKDDVVQILLNYNQYIVDLKDHRDYSPIHWAVENGILK